jgi:uncharacterized membrane protein (UPF0127 family)
VSAAAPVGQPGGAGSGGRQLALKGVAIIAVALVLVGVGMLFGRADSNESTAPSASTTTVGTGAPATTASGRAGIPGDFGEAVMVVTNPDGTALEWCLLAALTEAARQQGLMNVTDADLGGYDGMVFRFESDVTGGFWMRNTRLPLSIAYVDAQGGVVKLTDMSPCPDSAATCPSYSAGGRYRDAVEVPKGQFDRLGVSTESTLTFRDEACPPAA